LLELIAPPVVHFFDCGWKFIGTKKSLAQHVSRITGIPHSCLTNSTVPDDYSIAERMSWASRRETSRVEDTAYSLMGLFGINMPITYGEGKNAFKRLQEEILMRTTDQSFLDWRGLARSSSTLEAFRNVQSLPRPQSISLAERQSKS
jgi:hypothetical protein